MAKQKKLRLVEFDIKHISMIEAREHEAFGLLQMDNIHEKLAVMADASVECGTFMVEDTIICCGGFYELWEGVAECWVVPSIHVPKHVREFATTFKAYIERIMGELNYHRVQTVCLNDKLHNRWMKWLGMEPEGVLRKYSNHKEDFCMFSRVN